MTRFFVVLLAVFLMSGVPARAEGATSTSVAVVDTQQILAEADAAKDILAQMKTRRDLLEKEIKKIESSLKAAEQELIKKKSTMKPEEFTTARKEFEKKLIEGRTQVQKDRRADDVAFNAAINELRQNLVTVVSDLAAERKIQLVITKQNVVIGDNSLDITKDVMDKLNAKIKTIKVKVAN